MQCTVYELSRKSNYARFSIWVAGMTKVNITYASTGAATYVFSLLILLSHSCQKTRDVQDYTASPTCVFATHRSILQLLSRKMTNFVKVFLDMIIKGFVSNHSNSAICRIAQPLFSCGIIISHDNSARSWTIIIAHASKKRKMVGLSFFFSKKSKKRKWKVCHFLFFNMCDRWISHEK